ncbi:hypothetical protein BC938DRAFT_477608 [Jimgerdemannia flammicorona]|uniref:Uncharacterized protein n=1 Tax=Jimgerdemannia flammicorona TaxID=994334 RepID=A0A433QYW5_9FUNG|nr:hypothetical protein BC938DRAFT_477608 [Jimgerdemannia flammicorona]
MTCECGRGGGVAAVNVYLDVIVDEDFFADEVVIHIYRCGRVDILADADVLADEDVPADVDVTADVDALAGVDVFCRCRCVLVNIWSFLKDSGKITR